MFTIDSYIIVDYLVSQYVVRGHLAHRLVFGVGRTRLGPPNWELGPNWVWAPIRFGFDISDKFVWGDPACRNTTIGVTPMGEIRG